MHFEKLCIILLLLTMTTVSRTTRSSEKSNVLPLLKEVIATQIKFDDKQKYNVQIIETFVKKHMIEEMKKVDPMFAILYQEIYHTGSFYDGLRVGEATEFDLNVVLKVPFAETFLDLLHDSDSHPGFAKLRTKTALRFIVSPNHPMDQHQRSMENYLCEVDKNDKDKLYFSPDKLRRWIEGVTSNAVKKFALPSNDLKQKFGITKIETKKSGPAMTLLVEDGPVSVDIDLVPVIGLKMDILGPGDTAYYKSNKEVANLLNAAIFKDKSVKQFFLVPKPSPLKYLNRPIKDPRLHWRLDFHDHEKILLKDNYLGANQCSKSLIKLLKLFRDKNEPMKPVCSYVLKTTVMLMTKEKRNWKENNLQHLFVDALKLFHSFLSKKPCFVPFYFDSKCNILWKMKQTTADSVAKWLNKIILRLENPPDSVPILLRSPSTPDNNFVGLLNDLLTDNPPKYQMIPPQISIRIKAKMGGKSAEATAPTKQEAKEKAAKSLLETFNVVRKVSVTASPTKDGDKNAVVLLKERCELEKETAPIYLESGGDVKMCKVTALGEHGEGTGLSKKEAKIKAAENLLASLEKKRAGSFNKSATSDAMSPVRDSEKNAIALLKERCDLQKEKDPTYEFTECEGNMKKCKVTASGKFAEATGLSKKEAKTKAAENLLTSLENGKTSSHKKSTKLSESSNTVQERGMPDVPTYEEMPLTNQKYKCIVEHGKFKIEVEGGDKKEAKQKAAEALFSKISLTTKKTVSCSSPETIQEVWGSLFGTGKREE